MEMVVLIHERMLSQKERVQKNCVFVQSYKTPFSFLCQHLLPLAEIPLR